MALFSVMSCFLFIYTLSIILNVNAYSNAKLTRRPISKMNNRLQISQRRMAEVFELGDESKEENEEKKTDEQLGKTHGYEGAFKVGDVVKVTKDIRLWHVKAYSKDGFISKGFEGVVIGFDLYGRKSGTLCSAITPVRVEFQPDGGGIPSGMFDRKFVGHFSGEELELISRPSS